MAETPNVKITLIEQSQAQKEVTINEGFTLIDSILNNGAKDKDLATPPVSPLEGDAYIVATSPTGDWAGKAGQIAFFSQVWRFIVPKEGISLWVNDEDKIYSYNGTAWVSNANLRNLSDVNIGVSPTDNSFLVYDNASSKWLDEAPAAARTSMGLGTISTQNSNAVGITGGTVNGTSVGSTTPASGKFTALESSGFKDSATALVLEVESTNDSVKLTGQVPTTLGTKRHATANTAGNNLTLSGGGATAGATNKNGGTLILSGGVATGTGTSSVEIRTSSAGSSGVADNTPLARISVNGDNITFSGNILGGNVSVNAQTGTSYLVTSSDNGKIITLNNGAATTLTIPQTSTEALPKGFNISLVQLGTGEVTIAKQGSDNLYSEGNKLKLNSQYAQATIVKIVDGSPNTWVLSGSLKA